MKKIFAIVVLTSLCLLSIESCKKNNSAANEQAKKQLAINILGNWKATTITTVIDGAPTGTTRAGRDTEFYIFNTDTTGINKTDGTTEPFTYKVIDGSNIQINNYNNNCYVKINGLNMHIERYYGAPINQKVMIDFIRDQEASLYGLLTGKWQISSAKEINNGVTSSPTLDRFSYFNFNDDTTVNYKKLGGVSISDTKYKITSFNQFTFDTMQVNVGITNSSNISLNMVSTNNQAYKKEVTLRRF